MRNWIKIDLDKYPYAAIISALLPALIPIIGSLMSYYWFETKDGATRGVKGLTEFTFFICYGLIIIGLILWKNIFVIMK